MSTANSTLHAEALAHFRNAAHQDLAAHSLNDLIASPDAMIERGTWGYCGHRTYVVNGDRCLWCETCGADTGNGDGFTPDAGEAA